MGARVNLDFLFVLSKVAGALLAPGNLLLLALAAGLFIVRRRPRAGRRLAGSATAALFAIAVLPIGEWLLRPLEERFPILRTLPEKLDGIVVLGGSVSPTVSEARGQPALTEHSDRLAAALKLARRYPRVRIVFSGGSGSLLQREAKETHWIQVFLSEIGFDMGRLVLEGESRNTFENAVFTQRILKPRPDETWLLVTSALHMPRAVGCFRRIGWAVVPYPVGFRSTGREPLLNGFDLARELGLASAASKEWIGLAAYRLLGRTSELYPGPQEQG